MGAGLAARSGDTRRTDLLETREARWLGKADPGHHATELGFKLEVVDVIAIENPWQEVRIGLHSDKPRGRQCG